MASAYASPQTMPLTCFVLLTRAHRGAVFNVAYVPMLILVDWVRTNFSVCLSKHPLTHPHLSQKKKSLAGVLLYFIFFVLGASFCLSTVLL